jgi:NAD(P)-dependent dehydrogenase (short-subunit alcohol dehydrogenase family)
MSLPFKIDLTNKVIVISGAGGILCSMFATALAECGGKIALLDIDEAALRVVEQAITKQGGIAKGYKCNVLDKASIRQAHQDIINDFGTCNILINGAGGNNANATTDDEVYNPENVENIKTFFDLNQEKIEFVFNLNYLGTLLVVQEFAKDMVNKKGASIINISSMNAYTPLTKIPAYSGAKAAISNLTQWLAVYFSKVGIRCNAMAPGFFATKQNHDLLFNQDGSLTNRSEKIINQTPMKRFGEKEELIGTLLYLVSEEASSFVNGVIIPIDGGFNAYSGV